MFCTVGLAGSAFLGQPQLTAAASPLQPRGLSLRPDPAVTLRPHAETRPHLRPPPGWAPAALPAGRNQVLPDSPALRRCIKSLARSPALARSWYAAIYRSEQPRPPSRPPPWWSSRDLMLPRSRSAAGHTPAPLPRDTPPRYLALRSARAGAPKGAPRRAERDRRVPAPLSGGKRSPRSSGQRFKPTPPPLPAAPAGCRPRAFPFPRVAGRRSRRQAGPARALGGGCGRRWSRRLLVGTALRSGVGRLSLGSCLCPEAGRKKKRLGLRLLCCTAGTQAQPGLTNDWPESLTSPGGPGRGRSSPRPTLLPPP